MLRIGRKPGIEEYSGDSHHPWDNEILYSAAEYCLVGLDKWMQIHAFQSFEHPAWLKDCKTVEDAKKHAMFPLYEQYINSMLRLSGGQQVWQMNCMHPNLKDFWRIAIIMGQSEYRIWSRTDVYIRLPYYRLKAYLMNKFKNRF